MTDHDVAIRAAAGELTAEERSAWEARLSREPGLRVVMERTRHTAELVLGSRADGFQLGFAARVSRRLAEQRGRAGALADHLLLRYFRRLAPAALLAMLALGGYTLRPGRTAGQSTLEALLGLQPMNAEALLGAETSPIPVP